MPGLSLWLKYKLASGGRLWAARNLVSLLYTCAAPDLLPDSPDRKWLGDHGWTIIKRHIKEAYEHKDGSVFRVMAEAFEQPTEIDRIQTYVFFKLLTCDGKLPTQAELRRGLIKRGFADNDGLRKAVARACEISELKVPTDRPGRPRSKR
jgi:hypothetical protein